MCQLYSTMKAVKHLNGSIYPVRALRHKYSLIIFDQGMSVGKISFEGHFCNEKDN